jgi:hypothetical protein
VVALLIGCVSPIARHHAVLAYDRSVERVTTEQLLVNIIRAQSPSFRSTGEEFTTRFLSRSKPPSVWYVDRY